MKTNFGKKSLLVLTAFISAIATYNNPSNAKSNVSSSLPKPQVESTISQISQLPDSVTGVYAESSAHCKVGSYSWKISSETIEWVSVAYPSYAHINTITLQENGYNINADSFGLEFTRKEGLKSKLLKQNRQYRIVPDLQDNKIKLSVEDLTSSESVSKELVRCQKMSRFGIAN